MRYFKAPVLSMNFSENKKEMKKRFLNILDLNEKNKGILALGVIVLGVFIAGTLIGCSNNKTIKNDEKLQNKADNERLDTAATDMETAVSQAIFSRSSGKYLEGECIAEGHIILGNEDKIDAGTNKILESYVYALVSYGEYGFENGIFTKVSGSGAIPTKLTFSRNDLGEYLLIDYKQAEDGSNYTKSVRDMFPALIAERALHYTDFDSAKLVSQEEEYVKAYLVAVRSDAKISQNVEKSLSNMNVNASNTLGDLFNEYPYWIGTEEKIENGVRYVYEKKWEDKGNGNGVVTFRKYEYDSNNVVEETVIEVKDGELNYIKGDIRTERR